MVAAEHINYKMVKELLVCGADPNMGRVRCSHHLYYALAMLVLSSVC